MKRKILLTLLLSCGLFSCNGQEVGNHKIVVPNETSSSSEENITSKSETSNENSESNLDSSEEVASTVKPKTIEDLSPLEVFIKTQKTMDEKIYTVHCYGVVTAHSIWDIIQDVVSYKLHQKTKTFFESVSKTQPSEMGIAILSTREKYEDLYNNQFYNRDRDNDNVTIEGQQATVEKWNTFTQFENKDKYLEKYGHLTANLTNYTFYEGYEEKSFLSTEFVKKENEIYTYKYNLSCALEKNEGVEDNEEYQITDLKHINAAQEYAIEQKAMSGLSSTFSEIYFEMDASKDFIVQEIRTIEKSAQNSIVGSIPCESSFTSKFNVLNSIDELSDPFKSKYESAMTDLASLSSAEN